MGSIKDLIDYLINAVKFWVVVQPWERGIRVRFGKHQKLLKGGIHFRIPYIDSVYIQCVRMRVISLPMQNLTSKDFKTVTLNGCVGYEITNIWQLYNNMLYPEATISNIVMGAIADYVYSHNIEDMRPSEIENAAIVNLVTSDYGLKINYLKLTGFAVVKTFRLIQDHSWVNEGIKLDKKE